MKSNDAIGELCAAMRTEATAGEDFEWELGELVGKYRRKHERRMRDVEAARLLPLGAEVVRERQGGCRATIYNRAERGREILSNLLLCS